jgi:hypothetical protein
MATPLPVPFGGELVGEHIAFRWSLVHRDSAQVVAIGACDSEGTYLASKAHCPPECDFVDMPSTTNRDTNNILRFMAYDVEKKEFYLAKEKIEASGLTLDDVKAIMMSSAEPKARGPWETMPKTKATRAE